MAHFDNVKRPAFQLNSIVLRWHGRDGGLGNLAREQLVPHGLAHRHIAVHLFDRADGGDDLSVELVDEHACGEPMVAVSMGDEDVGELPVAGPDPLDYSLRLLAG